MIRTCGATLLLLLAVRWSSAQSVKSKNEVSGNSSDDYVFRIHAALPDYSFHIRRDSGGEVEGIEVRRGTQAQPIQILELTEDFDTAPRGIPMLAAEDVNFDGFADTKFMHWWGATGNTAYFYWLFDEDSGKFVYDDQFSQLYNVTPDSSRHEIRTHSTTGAAGNSYTSQVFRFEGRKLVLLHEEKQDWNQDKKCFYKVVQQRSGKEMKTISGECVKAQ